MNWRSSWANYSTQTRKIEEKEWFFYVYTLRSNMGYKKKHYVSEYNHEPSKFYKREDAQEYIDNLKKFSETILIKF